MHDIGLQVVRDAAGEIGFAVYVGGGWPFAFIAHKIRDFLPKADLLNYVAAILRVYNLEGRRDNKYKARIIKSFVHENGPRRRAKRSRPNSRSAKIPISFLPRISSSASRPIFALPDLPPRPVPAQNFEGRRAHEAGVRTFRRENVVATR